MNNVATHRQTIAREYMRELSLPGCSAPRTGVESPYFQRQIRGRRHPGRDINISVTMKVNVLAFENADLGSGYQPVAEIQFVDETTGLSVDDAQVGLNATTGNLLTSEQFKAQVLSAGLTYAAAQGHSVTSSDFVFPYPMVTLPPAPASYQTIVSQTGTAAPAVSGSLAPVSTYAAGTTFTWARSSAGVYTLTASTAVFNTSGKTAVFMSQLQNLNASARAVVTSSTVITVTTAVQSVAVLGLLGLTTTATDALLTQTMIYVQTYP